MGDFNAPPDTPEINRVIREGRFLDTYASLHAGSTGYTWSYENRYVRECHDLLPERRIDYIFVRNFPENLSAVEIAFKQPLKDQWPSDHFGLLASFQ